MPPKNTRELVLKTCVGASAIIFIVLGVFMIKTASSYSNPLALIGIMLQVVGVAGVAGLLVAHLVGGAVGDHIGFGIFFPNAKSVYTPELSMIKAKIKDEDYDAAITELETLVKSEPANIYYHSLLADIHIDKTRDLQSAQILLKNFLQRATKRSDDVYPIVIRLVDAYLDSNEVSKAIALLKKESTLKYTKTIREKIAIRLTCLEDSL